MNCAFLKTLYSWLKDLSSIKYWGYLTGEYHYGAPPHLFAVELQQRERQAAEKHKLDDIHPCRCVVKIMLHLRGLTFWTSTNTTTLLDFYSSREFTFLSCEVVLDCNVLKGSAPNRFLGGLLVLEGWRWYGKKTLASTWGWIEGIPMPGGLLLTCVIYKTLTVGTTIKRLM